MREIFAVLNVPPNLFQHKKKNLSRKDVFARQRDFKEIISCRCLSFTKDGVGFLEAIFSVGETKSLSMSAASTIHASAMQSECSKTATNLKKNALSGTLRVPRSEGLLLDGNDQLTVDRIE